MAVITDQFSVSTNGESHMLDVTKQVQRVVSDHDLTEGSALVFVSGSTAGLTTIEYEPGLKKDFPALFEKLAPKSAHYHHEDTWHDGNGHSHVRASLLGPSLSVPFSRGKLLLGTWQQILLVDFDNRPRERRVVVQLQGEA